MDKPKIFAPDDRPAPIALANIDEDAYHANREAVSQGKLQLLAYDSAAHFAVEWAKPHVVELFADMTPATRNGKSFHCATLEPKKFAAYKVQPHLGDGRTKEGKRARAEFIESLPDSWVDTDEEGAKSINGKATILKSDEYDTVCRMRDAVLNDSRVRSLGLFDGEPMTETSVFWVDDATGIYQRARIDLLSPKHGIVVDLKSCESTREHEFARSIAQHCYHFQGGSYLEAAHAVAPGSYSREDGFVFVAAERNAPFDVMVYELDPSDIAAGVAEKRIALTKLRACIDSDTWPGRSNKVVRIKRPAYAYAQAPKGEGF